jgi:hypothetical protein
MIRTSVYALALTCALPAMAETPWNESHPTTRPSTPDELQSRLERLAPGVDLSEAGEGGVQCRVLNSNGVPTQVVLTSDFGDRTAFIEYVSDGLPDVSVRFVVLPNFEGSPLSGHVQLFTTNDITNVTTPFGVPSWGLDATAGPWLLIVRNDRGGQAVCPFMVVAQ